MYFYKYYFVIRQTLPSIPLPKVIEDTYAVFIPPAKLFTAHCLADSDLAGNRRDRRSVSGILIMLGGAAIVYKTVLQKTIALSSTEAEFYALTEAGKMILYIRYVLPNVPAMWKRNVLQSLIGCKRIHLKYKGSIQATTAMTS